MFSVQVKPVIQIGLLSYDSIILPNSALTGYNKDVYMSVHIRSLLTICLLRKKGAKIKPTFSSE